jgi:hypothetical protein
MAWEQGAMTYTVMIEKGAPNELGKPLRVFAFGFAAHEPQNGRLETTVYERGADVLHAIRRQ